MNDYFKHLFYEIAYWSKTFSKHTKYNMQKYMKKSWNVQGKNCIWRIKTGKYYKENNKKGIISKKK